MFFGVKSWALACDFQQLPKNFSVRMKDSEEEQKIESRRTVERELNEKGRKSWAEAASATEYAVAWRQRTYAEFPFVNGRYHYYRRVPIVATLVTFGIGSLWVSLLSVGRYFREGSLLSGRSSLSGGRYLQLVVTFGGSLLSGNKNQNRFQRELARAFSPKWKINNIKLRTEQHYIWIPYV